MQKLSALFFLVIVSIRGINFDMATHWANDHRRELQTGANGPVLVGVGGKGEVERNDVRVGDAMPESEPHIT